MPNTAGQAAWVALLRGINVGGTHKVPMAELRTLLTATGLADVRTYIQSGNAVFSSDLAEARLVTLIQDALRDRFGFAIATAVRSAKEFRTALDASPFADADPSRAYLAFLSEPATKEALARLNAAASDTEEVRSIGRELHLNFPEGMASSKLAAGLPKLVGQEVCTARNLRTCRAIAGMLG